MPRVRGNTANTAGGMKTVQIPLNDDREEKAARLQSRQAAHTKQMEQYKAVASPAKKRKSLGDSMGPSTPSQDPNSSQHYDVAGTAVTPMKRVPILANFEEWMKMATDNKINATNSWNFALIDYFHDMSLLREGDGRVNFQKASCTLDGCVKIYTSRVDSVATETGKLLSGLAESRDKKSKKGGDDAGEEGEGEDGEEDEEDGDGSGKKKSRKKAQRNAEATLATSFDQLRLKKMELEFSVDPLFKKASADFDEGGAKGLLLNHLSIDGTGRIVFDSSDDAQETSPDDSRRDSMEPDVGEEEEKSKEASEAVMQDGPIDVAALGARFFPDLSKLDSQHICPSLKTFELGAGDAAMDLPFLKAPENWRDEHPEVTPNGTGTGDETVNPDNDNNNTFSPDYDNDDAGFDLPPETGFGEGGEAWARDAALEPQMRVHDIADGSEEAGEVGTFDTDGATYGVKLHHRSHDSDEQENILQYFDTALRKNWAGPEHWKIAKIREANKAAQAPKEKRKEKEPFEIDFAAPMTQELATVLYTSASSNATISLPKKDWKSKSRNLLPDDKHFNSRDLLRLFLKPKARIGARRGGAQRRLAEPAAGEGEIDEAYWATNAGAATAQPDEDAVQGDYDANFFQDDNLPLPGGMEADDDDDFADAREHFSPGADEVDAAGGSGPEGIGIDGIIAGSSQEGGADEGAFGANLIAQSRRSRPEYVQYARVAKKVDVRRLKEEMWRGIGFEAAVATEQPNTPTPAPPTLAKDKTDTLHFVDIMNNLKHVYPKQQMLDISTSFGFISLLHLANEKGLVIESVEGWEDLTVRKDWDAVVTGD